MLRNTGTLTLVSSHAWEYGIVDAETKLKAKTVMTVPAP